MVYPENLVIGLELKHIVYALIIAVIAYAIREYRRWRNSIRPLYPDMELDDAWQRCLQSIANHPDARFIPAGLAPASAREPVRQDAEHSLLHLAEQVRNSDDHERHIIRRMILANATLALQLDALSHSSEQARLALIKGYDAGMAELVDNAVASSMLKWIVLRQYAHWKFDDAVADDWFHEYMGQAGPYIREKVRLAKEHVLQADSGAGRFAELYDTLLGEIRDKMLKVRPKRRFVPTDLPESS